MNVINFFSIKPNDMVRNGIISVLDGIWTWG